MSFTQICLAAVTVNYECEIKALKKATNLIHAPIFHSIFKEKIVFLCSSKQIFVVLEVSLLHTFSESKLKCELYLLSERLENFFQQMLKINKINSK